MMIPVISKNFNYGDTLNAPSKKQKNKKNSRKSKIDIEM